MEPQFKLAFDQMMEEGLTLGEIIENAIMYAAETAAAELQGHAVLDLDDAYDAIREGIRTSAEIRANGPDVHALTNTQLRDKIKYWERDEQLHNPVREDRLRALIGERTRRGLSTITA